MPELRFKLELLGLYDRFIERKHESCLEKNGKISTIKVFAKVAVKELVKNIAKGHQILAL